MVYTILIVKSYGVDDNDNDNNDDHDVPMITINIGVNNNDVNNTGCFAINNNV